MLKNFKEIYQTLNQNFRLRLKVLLLLIVVKSFLEIVSIGAFLPLLKSLFLENYLINNFYIFGLTVDTKTFKLFVLIAIMNIFFIKFLFNLFNYRYLEKFLFDIRNDVSKKLFFTYLYRPIDVSIIEGESNMYKNIQIETNVFRNVIFSFVRFLGDILLLLFIIAFLFYVNFIVTLIVFLIIIIFFGIYYIIFKNFILEKGKIRYDSDAKLSLLIQQSFSYLKEIKIFNLYDTFMKYFYHHLSVTSWTKVQKKIISQIPVFLSEVLVIFFISLTVIYHIYFDKNLDELFVILAIYSLCSIKILPVANNMLNNIQTYEFSKKSINKVLIEINKFEFFSKTGSLNDGNFFFRKNIVFKNIFFKYPNSKRFNLSIENFEIKKNSFIGLVGQSGEGKSTLVNLISGLLNPTSGKILSDGVDIQKNLFGWRNKIGLVSQHVYILNETLKDNICIKDFHNKKYDDVLYKKLVKDFNLEKIIDKVENQKLGQGGTTISIGQKQRIGIARAMYIKPEILVLDEPTSALDEENENNFLKMINELKGKMTILFITHNFSNLINADEIYEIKDGVLKKKLFN